MASNVSSSLSSLQSNVTSNMNTATQNASTAANTMQNNVNKSASGINQSSTKEITSMARNVGQSMQNMERTASSAMQRVSNTVNKGFSSVSKASTQSMSQATRSISSSTSQMVSTFNTGMNRMVSTARNSSSRIVSAFSSLRYQMNSIGYYAGAGLASGLSSSSGYIYSVANSIAYNVRRTLQRALDIHSPSRITTWMGEMLGKGLGLGMHSMLGFVTKQANEFGSIIRAQQYQAEALMVADTTFTNKNISTLDDEMDRDVADTELRQEEIYVYNEIIGDKIYTTVKRKEARDKNKNDYFN